MSLAEPWDQVRKEGERVEAGSDHHSTGKEIAQQQEGASVPACGVLPFFGVRLRQLMDGEQRLQFAKVSFPGSRGWCRALVIACCGR